MKKKEFSPRKKKFDKYVLQIYDICVSCHTQRHAKVHTEDSKSSVDLKINKCFRIWETIHETIQHFKNDLFKTIQN